MEGGEDGREARGGTEESRGGGAAVEPGEILHHLEALARPRLTGSAGARAVEEELCRRYRDLGWEARRLEFSFSTLPGRFGLPLAGGAITAMAGAGGLLGANRPATALALLLAGVVLASAPLLLLGPALRRLPRGRVETANLLFTRGDPTWLVMAHRDTKSQPVPTLVRTVALAAAAVAWATLAASATARLPGPAPGWVAAEPVTWTAAVVLAATGLVLASSGVGNASPGALDNGTGLAALLALAARVGPDTGFLVTDGEELGLAGARAVADRLPEVRGIVNLDGLDDVGPIRIAEGRGRSGAALGGALLEEARRLGLEAVRRPLPPFLLVDHQPLAASGLPALTVLKGRWSSLLRVHRPGDTTARLSGTGAAAVATLVAATLGAPPASGSDTLRPDERSGHSPAP